MKRYAFVLVAVAICQFGAARGVSAQVTLEGSYADLKASLLDTGSAASELPQPGAQIVETYAEKVWPLPGPAQWYWHTFNAGLSMDQIKAGAAGFKSGILYLPGITKKAGNISSIKVVKPSSSWFGTTKYSSQLNVYTDLVNNDVVSLAGTNDYSHFETPIIADAVNEVKVFYDTRMSQDAKWVLLVRTKSALGVNPQGFFNFYIYLKTEAEARKLADMVVSCRKLDKLPELSQSKLSFTTADLTPAQVDALGKTRLDSVLVTNVALDGPADKANLLFLDIITEVNGVKVRNAGHFDSLIEAAAPGSALKLSCLTRTKVAGGDQKTYVWNPKTVVLTVP